MAEFTLPEQQDQSRQCAAPMRQAPPLFKVYRTIPKQSQPSLRHVTIDLDNAGRWCSTRSSISDEIDPPDLRPLVPLGYLRSCSINMDGRTDLACHRDRGHQGEVKITPLPHLDVVKDLVPDSPMLTRSSPRSSRGLRPRAPSHRGSSGCKVRRTGASSTACTSASCASAAPRPAPAIGGTATSFWAPRCCSRPIASSPTAVTR